MQSESQSVIVVGGGPAGLMAAERLACAGYPVTIVDSMPSIGRKLLMAGRTGLNLTNAENLSDLIARYGHAAEWLAPYITRFSPDAVQEWARDLGQPCFTGSSGHVFPTAMKASPLLRAWIKRLEDHGVRFLTRTTFKNWKSGIATLETPNGPTTLTATAIVLACGGASWPRLGATGAWTALFPDQTTPFAPANCGALPDWSDARLAEFAGTPLKRIGLSLGDHTARGDLMIGRHSIEGAPLYHLIPQIRTRIPCILHVDLRPDLDEAALIQRIARTRPRESRSNRLRKAIGLDPIARVLVADARPDNTPEALARAIKCAPLPIVGTAGLDRAISVAGGLRLDALISGLMLKNQPGMFACGEMLDWEAPTGGYLLQACLATGFAAGEACAQWLARKNSSDERNAPLIDA